MEKLSAVRPANLFFLVTNPVFSILGNKSSIREAFQMPRSSFRRAEHGHHGSNMTSCMIYLNFFSRSMGLSQAVFYYISLLEKSFVTALLPRLSTRETHSAFLVSTFFRGKFGSKKRKAWVRKYSHAWPSVTCLFKQYMFERGRGSPTREINRKWLLKWRDYLPATKWIFLVASCGWGEPSSLLVFVEACNTYLFF